MDWDAVRMVTAVGADYTEADVAHPCTIMHSDRVDLVRTIHCAPKIFPIIVTCV